MKKLENKIALVTGGGRGIGEAISYAFAEEGADLGVVYVNDKRRADQVCNIVKKRYGGKAISIKADISSPQDVQNMADTMLKEYGRIDVLVNNAGSTIPGTLENTTLELWNKVISVDLTGVFLCTKAVAPSMIARKQGRIINVSSSSIFFGQTGHLAYAVAKGGVNTFTKVLARELVKYGILVNSICPGPTETELYNSLTEEIKERVKGSLPLGRISKSEETAKTAVFLASSDSDCYVGQNLMPNCGEFML